MTATIHISTVVSGQSSLSVDEFGAFEEKVRTALSRCCADSGQGLYCEIAVDGNIPDEVKSQFAKVKSNVFTGFADNNIEASVRRAILFELMAIKDDAISRADHIVIIVSSRPIAKSAGKQGSESDDEDKLPSFEATAPKYSLNKVILDDATKNQIMRSVALIDNQKLIFDTWGFREVDPSTKTILCFFGAPGTGKTMCAHALAKELGKNILIASYASIESKWVGEGPKNMRKIFQDAAEQDAVLFFDEADSFLSKRVNNAETGSDKHYNRMSNEMFQLLEDFDGVVIFATNLVTDFDKAFKSRILSFIEFTLPDTPTRKRLIGSMLPSKLPLSPALSDSDFDVLAEASEGFSGREIRKALLTSLSEAALNGRVSLTVDDLAVGFHTVQDERKAIEATATKERNLISDFMEVSAQNESIINVCRYAIDNFGELTVATKDTLFKISLILNLEMPDLSAHFGDKDISEDCRKIIDTDRVAETLRFVVYLLSAQNAEREKADDIIESICRMVQCTDSAPYKNYLSALNSIKK